MASKTSKADEELLKLAKERFQEGSEAWEDNRRAAEDDFRMLDGQQWDEISLQDREGRPCLVINKLAGVQKQITGDQRQNRPSIKIQPVDSESDPETAEIYTGLIRNIEQQSDAESAYDTAFEQCSGGGFGFFRINTEYAQEDIFEQDITIERILDPFSVTFDPYAKRQDKEDARYVFVEETLPLAEFEDLYPDAVPANWESEYADDQSQWYTNEHVRIAEYWYKEEYEKIIYQLETGEVVDAAEVVGSINEEEGVKFLVDAQTQQPVRIVKERKALCTRVKWCLMTGHAILEKADWKGKYIPIVGVWGDERWVGGVMTYKSAIRDGKDSQKIYNWMRSTEVEVVSQAPRQPYMVTPEMIDGHENEWNTMHEVPRPYLTFNMTQDGVPQRIGGSIPDIGAQHQSAIAADDIKATTGIYDASLGKQGTATSGIQEAYQQRKGDTATFVYVDNLARAMRHAGRIIIDLVPHTYDEERVVRVLGEDGSEAFEEVNKTVLVQKTPQHPEGTKVLNDLTTGKYDVVVNTGPSYSTQRIEAAESMMAFAQAVPSVAAVTVDLIAKAQDWPGADEFVKRAEKTLPPGFLEKDMDDLSPEEQQAMQQQQQEQQKQQQLQEMQMQMGLQTQQIEMKQKEIELAMTQLEMAKVQAETQKTTFEAEGQDLDNVKTEIEIQQEIGALGKPKQEVN